MHISVVSMSWLLQIVLLQTLGYKRIFCSNIWSLTTGPNTELLNSLKFPWWVKGMSFVLMRQCLMGSWMGAGHWKDQTMIRSLGVSAPFLILQEGKSGGKNWLKDPSHLRDEASIKSPMVCESENFQVAEDMKELEAVYTTSPHLAPCLFAVWMLLCISSNCCCCVAQSCLTLCDPMDWSPPGSSVHGISQARMLGWAAISFSRGSSWSRDRTHISCTGRQVLYCWTIRETHISSYSFMING